MAVNGIDIVEQLRGRMRFYHVGDPVRVDMRKACDFITELLEVQLRETHTAASVADWLDGHGIKLLPWQRKRMGLAPTRMDPEKQ